MFDKHPKMWNLKDIIHEMHNMEADIMLEKQADDDMLIHDNPFTM